MPCKQLGSFQRTKTPARRLKVSSEEEEDEDDDVRDLGRCDKGRAKRRREHIILKKKRVIAQLTD
jgi:hypothetical protein